MTVDTDHVKGGLIMIPKEKLARPTYYDPTPQQRANLVTLAESILTLEQEAFSMDRYVTSVAGLTNLIAKREAYLKAEFNSCGTVCCALGWAGLIPEIKIEGPSLDRDDYCIRVFGLGTDTRFKGQDKSLWVSQLEMPSKPWNWLFSGHWCYEDNTPEGFTKRAYMLLNDEVNWKYYLQD